MTALWNIAEQYRADVARLVDLDLDPQTLADTLESMSGELEVKAQSVAFVVRSLRADAAAMKAWADEATARAKAVEARADHLREYLAHTLQACGIKKIEGPGIALSFRATSSVIIDALERVPVEYLHPQKPAPAREPNKKAIGEAIKAGIDIEWAHIETRQSLQIK